MSVRSTGRFGMVASGPIGGRQSPLASAWTWASGGAGSQRTPLQRRVISTRPPGSMRASQSTVGCAVVVAPRPPSGATFHALPPLVRCSSAARAASQRALCQSSASRWDGNSKQWVAWTQASRANASSNSSSSSRSGSRSRLGPVVVAVRRCIVAAANVTVRPH